MNDEPTHWYSRFGIWFWIVIALGLGLRVYLVGFTEGTKDVEIWERHARDVLNNGLIGYYHLDPTANHPPFITEVETLLLRVSDATGIPFRILLRAPFTLVDLGTTFLLILLLRECRWRFFVASAYWLNPLSIIFSAYHGNTDSAVAFFLVLCLWLLSKNKLLAAGITLGVSLWIKLPSIVAIPAFFFFIENWRKRFQFLLIIGIVGLATYVPALIQDPAIIWKNVFGYRAPLVHSTAGVPSWGPSVVLFSLVAPDDWPVSLRPAVIFLLENGWLMGLALVFLFVWLRRSRREVSEVAATIGASYVIVLALSGGFSFQYFAWALPFWLFLPRWFFVPAIALVSGYIYFLYVYFCGDPWLLGFWDFLGHPYWPLPVIVLRDLAYLLFCVAAIWFLIAEILRVARRSSPQILDV
jgi:hypothetical protein